MKRYLELVEPAKDAGITCTNSVTGEIVRTFYARIMQKDENALFGIGFTKQIGNLHQAGFNGETIIPEFIKYRKNQIPLSQYLQIKITDYCAQAPIENYCDCGSFILHILEKAPLGSGKKFPKTQLLDQTLITKFSSENIQPEDIVVTGKGDLREIFNFDHVAIYLGSGLYLSKFGNMGPLLITTHNEMLQLYSSTDTFVVTDAIKDFTIDY